MVNPEEVKPNLEVDLYVNIESKVHLKQTAFWAKFLSIMALSLLGLLVIFMVYLLFFGTIAKELNGEGQYRFYSKIFIYFLTITVLLYPLLKLLRYSVYLKKSISENDAFILENALKAEKSKYQFISILSLVAFIFLMIMMIQIMVSVVGVLI